MYRLKINKSYQVLVVSISVTRRKWRRDSLREKERERERERERGRKREREREGATITEQPNRNSIRRGRRRKTHTYLSIYLSIYLSRERERERVWQTDRQTDRDRHTNLCKISHTYTNNRVLVVGVISKNRSQSAWTDNSYTGLHPDFHPDFHTLCYWFSWFRLRFRTSHFGSQ